MHQGMEIAERGDIFADLLAFHALQYYSLNGNI